MRMDEIGFELIPILDTFDLVERDCPVLVLRNLNVPRR